MDKKPSTLFNMISTLMLITLISGFLLGYFNNLTEEPKARVKAALKVKAINYVLPTYDNDLLKDVVKIKDPNSKDSIEVYTAYSKRKLVGIALMGTSKKGFSGDVKCMVGYLPDGKINKIMVMEQKETPGLGTKMKDENFIQQFLGKNPQTDKIIVKKDGGNIDALTGATISSRAFCETINSSFSVIKENETLIFNNKSDVKK